MPHSFTPDDTEYIVNFTMPDNGDALDAKVVTDALEKGLDNTAYVKAQSDAAEQALANVDIVTDQRLDNLEGTYKTRHWYSSALVNVTPSADFGTLWAQWDLYGNVGCITLGDYTPALTYVDLLLPDTTTSFFTMELQGYVAGGAPFGATLQATLVKKVDGVWVAQGPTLQIGYAPTGFRTTGTVDISTVVWDPEAAWAVKLKFNNSTGGDNEINFSALRLVVYEMAHAEGAISE